MAAAGGSAKLGFPVGVWDGRLRGLKGSTERTAVDSRSAGVRRLPRSKFAAARPETDQWGRQKRRVLSAARLHVTPVAAAWNVSHESGSINTRLYLEVDAFFAVFPLICPSCLFSAHLKRFYLSLDAINNPPVFTNLYFL